MRTYRPTLFAVVVVVAIASWYGMQAAHELGHVLGAVATGGVVQRVEFPLIGFSRTVVDPSPMPLVEVWAGPIIGVALPLALMALVRGSARAIRACVLFFAGFCLIANGAYLGVGAFTGAGDAGDLLMLGAPRWTLVAFGVLGVPLGLFLWHIASMRRLSVGSGVTRASR